MKDVAIWVMFTFSMLQAGIVYYFFIYKNKQADREYQRKMKELDGLGRE